MTDKYIDLSWVQLALASTLILACALLSLLLRLGLARRLIVAAVRMVLQLILIGLVLRWIFSLKQWYAVVCLILVMSIVGGVAAVQQTNRNFPGIWLNGTVSVIASSWLMLFLALAVIVGAHPWYAPQYAIPFAGMILGNTLNGVALTLDRFAEELVLNRDRIEGLLALGATRREAAILPMRKAFETGMLPTINMMLVAGIVYLPGTMTGQLLAGVDPVSAVRYQIVIMFVLVAGTALGTVSVILVSYRRLFNKRHQFLFWLITTPQKGFLARVFSS
jgi:putative ABC transport system permease protein